jgi:hypothetical protein
LKESLELKFNERKDQLKQAIDSVQDVKNTWDKVSSQLDQIVYVRAPLSRVIKPTLPVSKATTSGAEIVEKTHATNESCSMIPVKVDPWVLWRDGVKLRAELIHLETKTEAIKSEWNYTSTPTCLVLNIDSKSLEREIEKMQLSSSVQITESPTIAMQVFVRGTL